MVEALTPDEVADRGKRLMQALLDLSNSLMSLHIGDRSTVVLEDDQQLQIAGMAMAIATTVHLGGRWQPTTGEPFRYMGVWVTSRPRYVSQVLQSEGREADRRLKAVEAVRRRDAENTWQPMWRRPVVREVNYDADSVKGA